MKPLLRRLLPSALLAVAGTSAWAVPDPGWVIPTDGETFQTQAPLINLETTAGVFCEVDFDNDIKEVAFYEGTNLVRMSNRWFPSTTPGKRRFYARIGLPTSGFTTLKAIGTDGFTTVTITGATINLTTAAPAPVFAYEPAQGISSAFATLYGSVNTRGAASSSGEIKFQYGTTTAYGMQTSQTYSFLGRCAYQRDLEGEVRIKNLQPGTVYHYRQVYHTPTGTIYSPDYTFTTAVNEPPVAGPDIAVIQTDGRAIAFPLSNDTDEGLDRGYDPLTLVSATNGSHGTTEVSISGQVRIRYTPGPTFTGLDTFTYRVADQFGAESEGTVEVRSVAEHRKAIAGSYSTTLNGGGGTDIVGSISVNVTKLGAYSGTLTLRGISNSFTGVLPPDEEGYFESSTANKVFTGAGLGPFRWGFIIYYDNDGYPTISGGSNAGGPAAFDITHAMQLLPATEETLEAGIYNLALPNPDESLAYVDSQPQGDGFATMRVSRKGGRMATTGRTGDGQPFSAGGRMRKDRNILLSAASGVNRKARLSGLMGFDLSEERSSGELNWVNKSRARGLYADHFQMKIQAQGEKFVPPARNTPIFSFAAGAQPNVEIEVRNHEGAVISDDTAPLVKNRLDTGASDPSRVRIAINPRNGLFTGTLVEPGKKPIRLMGIVQPEAGIGVGVAGPTGADGSVRLSVP